MVVPKELPEPNQNQQDIEQDRFINFYADTNINAMYMHRKALIVQCDVKKFSLKMIRQQITFRECEKKDLINETVSVGDGHIPSK